MTTEVDWDSGVITFPDVEQNWEQGAITEPPKPSGLLRRVGDQGIKLAQGVIGVPETAVGLADLVSNGYAGKAAEDAGVRFKDAKAVLGEYLSPEQQAADREVNDAKGFFPTVGAMVQNPSTIIGGAMESAPSMLSGGVASRGLLAVAPRIGAIAAGAAGEGIVTAGQNAEQLRQETSDGLLTPEQSALMAGSGALTGLIGFGAGKVANKLGIGDVQTMLARGKLGAVGAEAEQAAANKGFLRKVGEGFASEGILQELPQSYQEQVAQNLAQVKPWDQGAAEAGAQGMMAGALMGGGANAASHFAEGAPKPPPAQQQPQQETPPQQETLQLGRNPDAGALIQYPDGSVAYKSDVENFINSLPEDEQPAARAQFMGYAPQPANPDESAINPDDPAIPPQQTKSEAMGLVPTDAPSITNAAIAAVETGAHDIEQANAAQEQAATLEQAAQATKVETPKVDQKNIAIEIAKSLRQEIATDAQAGVIRQPQEQERSMLLGLLDVQDGGNLSNQELESRLSAKQRKDFEWLQGFAGTERIAVRRNAQQQQTTQSDLSTPPTTGEPYGNQSVSTQQEIPAQQSPGQDATRQEGLLNPPTLTQQQEAPSYDGLPVEQRAEILQQIPGLVSDAGDFNIIGKAMLNRPLEQMRPDVRQAVEQIISTPQQDNAQTPQAIAPEAQQPTQQPTTQPTPTPLSVPDRLRAQREQLSASALQTLNLPKDERQRQQALKGELRDRLGLNPGQNQAAPKRSPFKEFIVANGISDSPADVVGESNAFRANNILPRAFRKNGLSLDALAERAVQAGYITQDDLDAGNAHTVLASMIQDEVAGRKVHLPMNMQTDDAAAKTEAYRRAEMEDAADKYGLPYDQYTRTDNLASMVRRVQTRLEQPESTGLLKPDRILRNAQEAVARIERKRAQESERYQQFAKLTIDEQDATIDVLTDDNGHPVFARRADADTHDAWHQAQQQWSDLYGEAYTPDNAEQQSVGKDQAPTAGITEASPGSAQGNDTAAQPGSAPVQDGTGQSQQEQTFGLTSPTRSDVLTQQAAVEAEAARKEQGGDKPITRKVTADQVDLFNPQGGLFDAPADEPAPPPASLKEGLARIRAANQATPTASQAGAATESVAQDEPLSVPEKLRAKRETGAPTSAAQVTPDATHQSVMADVREGKATPEQFKASFESVVANEAAIKAELTAKTKVQLLREGGPFVQMRFANENKSAIVDAVYRSMVEDYTLGESYSYGIARDSRMNAIRRLVDATDAAKLDQFVKDRAAATEKYVTDRAARAESLKNPQTLDDYKRVIQSHINEGKTRQEAFLQLTPEQRTKYDTLDAESTKESRESRKRASKTEVRAASQTTGGEIIATKHTRDGYDLFVVQLSDRLSKEDYQTVLASAKKLGGWYSAFRGAGAIQGFQFKSRDNAQAFLNLAGGDTAQAKQQAEQRRDAFEDDRSQSAAERLTEMSDKLEDSANEDLGRDRKANTERRARLASSALNAAEEQKALAKTMRNIAQAIGEGKAKFLDAVRSKTQVEMLHGFVRTAQYNELRAKYASYADQEKHKGQPATAETADFAEFPTFTAFRSDLATLARQMLEVDGTKKLGQQLMGVADDVTDAYLEFAKENLLRVSAFGRNNTLADFSSKDSAERAIKQNHLTGKAIVLPVKRGKNRVVLSPSEAMNRGIWTGAVDKRITLKSEYGNELVEAIGRRGNKQNQLSVPWQLQNAYDRRKSLARIGVETPSEFRSALREFIALQEAATTNKVRAMELSMVGRKADGLDFFPTPADVADQMVEAADIKPDMAVLEPSAGMGHIADRIREAGVEPDVVEIAPDRRELLQEKGFHLAEVDDFMQMEPRKFFTYGDVFRAPDGVDGTMRGMGGIGSQRVRLDDEDGNRLGLYDRNELTGIAHRGVVSGYDRIIMNPPFSDRRDAQHVQHAYTLLKPGGRIVAIMGEGVFFGNDKKAQDFRDWLESVGGTSEKLPAGSFNDPSLPVGTSANARMVTIDKPQASEDGGNVAMFATGASSGSFVSAPVIENLYKQITKGFSNPPNVQVVQSVFGLPFFAPADVKGVYLKGTVYLVARNIGSTAEAKAVIAHELIGHYGLAGFFGRELSDVLDEIHKNNVRVQLLAAKWMRDNQTLIAQWKSKYGMNDAQVKSRSIEEALASMAEKGENLSGWKRIAAVIQSILRKMGLTEWANSLEAKTDAEALLALKKAEMFARKGWTNDKGAPAFMYPMFSHSAPDKDIPAFSRTKSLITNQDLPTTWQSPDASKLDTFIYSMQDKHIDTRRMVEAINQTIGAINEQQNPYLQEELYHGRAAMSTKEFLEKQVRPLLVELRTRGITMEDLEAYLHNRHAEARNIQAAKINPNNQDMQDGGSGIKTADARAYLAALTPAQTTAFKSLASKVEKITRSTRELLVSSGLEKQSTIGAWEKAYGDEYVPLQREEMENGMGIGQGISTRGSASKRFMGSDKKVVNIFSNIVMAHERAITRSEKKRIGEALYGLVLKAPNPDFWFAIDPALEQNPKKVMDTMMQLVNMGLDPADADSIAREPATRYVNPITNTVESRINPAMRSAENVLAVRIDGEDKFVFFNKKDERAMRMVKALKNLDSDQLGEVMGAVSKATRYFSAVNTQFNPIFGVSNLLRDIQTGMLNLQSTALKGKQSAIAKNVVPALIGIYSDLRKNRDGKAATSDYAKLFEEFQREGGATGYRDMFANAQERADAIEQEIKDISAGKAKQLSKGILGWLSDYNEAMENSVRLSAYKVAKEQGLSNQQAASLAKNLTVNFNRKGQVALQAGALYAFFNASVQGTARIAQTLTEDGKLSTVGKQIIVGGLTLGAMQAVLLAAAGFDDGEPPDFVREKNLIIPIGGSKYVSIPMPLGFHVIPGLARIPTEWAIGGFKNTPKRIAQIAAMFAEAMNPIGSAGLSMQTLAPTVLDPFAALTENRDWTGKPIAKLDFNSMRPTAGHTRAKDTATPWATFLSKAVNYATGGDEYKPGVASPTPDQIDYLIGQVTGGVGREISKAAQVVKSATTGEDLPLFKTPLLGRFVGTTEGNAAESSRFYENLKQIGAHKAEIDGLKRDRKPLELIRYLRDNPDAKLLTAATHVEEQIQKLTHLRRALVKKDTPPERVKAINDQITSRMAQFNKMVKQRELAAAG